MGEERLQNPPSFSNTLTHPQVTELLDKSALCGPHSSLPWCSSYTPILTLLCHDAYPTLPSFSEEEASHLMSAGSHLCSWSCLWLPDHLKPGSWTLLKWLSQNFFWLSDPRVYLCLPSRWWFYNPGAACWSFSLSPLCTIGYHWITCLGEEPVFCWLKAHHRRMSGGLPFTSCRYGQEGSGRAK